MKLLWISANRLGYELLKTSLEITDIDAILTLSEYSKTRMYDGICRENWYKFNIPVYEIERLNDEEDLIKNMSPDMIIICGWRQLVGDNILKIPTKGVIGFHPTLLPYGRGPAPIINTILENFSETGITMFYLDSGLDSGDIIGQKKFSVEKTDFARDIYEKAIYYGKELLKEYLPLLIRGTAPRKKQNENEATYFKKRSLKDNEIDLNNDSIDLIQRKIRAFAPPYLGAYIKKDGKKIRIYDGEIEDE